MAKKEAPIVTGAAPVGKVVDLTPVLDANAKAVIAHRDRLVDLGSQRRKIHGDFVAARSAKRPQDAARDQKEHEALRAAMEANRVESQKTQNVLREVQKAQRAQYGLQRRENAPVNRQVPLAGLKRLPPPAK
jgi:hypothetical protein